MFAYDASQFEFNYGTPVLPDFGSPSARPGEQSQNPSRGGQGLLPLLQLCDWNSDFQDDDVNPTCIHYDIEWKLQLRKNKKSTTLAEITEENLTLAPGAYWEKYLCLALAKMVEGVILGSGPVRFEGVVVVPYRSTVARILRTLRSVQGIVWAMSLMGTSSRSRAQILSRFSGVSRGVIRKQSTFESIPKRML